MKCGKVLFHVAFWLFWDNLTLHETCQNMTKGGYVWSTINQQKHCNYRYVIHEQSIKIKRKMYRYKELPTEKKSFSCLFL